MDGGEAMTPQLSTSQVTLDQGFRRIACKNF